MTNKEKLEKAIENLKLYFMCTDDTSRRANVFETATLLNDIAAKPECDVCDNPELWSYAIQDGHYCPRKHKAEPEQPQAEPKDDVGKKTWEQGDCIRGVGDILTISSANIANALQANIDRLKAELACYKEGYPDKLETIKQYEKELDDLEAELAEAKADKMRWMVAAEDYRAAIIPNLKRTIDRLEDENKQWQDAIKFVREHRDRLTTELAEAEAKIERLEAAAKEAVRLIGFMTNRKIASATAILREALKGD